MRKNETQHNHYINPGNFHSCDSQSKIKAMWKDDWKILLASPPQTK